MTIEIILVVLVLAGLVAFGVNHRKKKKNKAEGNVGGNPRDPGIEHTEEN